LVDFLFVLEYSRLFEFLWPLSPFCSAGLNNAPLVVFSTVPFGFDEGDKGWTRRNAPFFFLAGVSPLSLLSFYPLLLFF